MGFIKEKIESIKKGLAEKKQERVKLRQARTKAYKSAKLKEAERYGKERARLETDKKLEPYKPRKTNSTFRSNSKAIGQSKTGLGRNAVTRSKRRSKKTKSKRTRRSYEPPEYRIADFI